MQSTLIPTRDTMPNRAPGHTDLAFCSRPCLRCDREMSRRSRIRRAELIADAFGRRGSRAWRDARATALG